MTWLLLSVLSLGTGLVLIGPFMQSGKTPPARQWITLFLLGFVGLAIGIYALIGSAELTQKDVLKPYKPQTPVIGPSEADVKAAQNMSPKERAAMIIAMVDSLAAKLEDNPDNPQGWSRLLRARTVLGQDDQKAADIETVKNIYAEQPEILSQVLKAAEP